MKYAKMLGLAAIAAMALMAFAANSASATTLESGATILPEGTEIVASLTAKTSAELTDTNGNPLDTCTESTVSGKTEQKTAPTLSGKATVTWGGCTSETKTLNGGTLTISWIEGTTNGTITSDNAEVTINGLFGTSCIYGTSSTDLGVLKGVAKGDATLSINAVVEEKEPKKFLCPDTGIWKANYSVTSPTPLGVIN